MLEFQRHARFLTSCLIFKVTGKMQSKYEQNAIKKQSKCEPKATTPATSHYLGRVNSHKPLRKRRKGGKHWGKKKMRGTLITIFTPFSRNCPEDARGSSKLVWATWSFFSKKGLHEAAKIYVCRLFQYGAQPRHNTNVIVVPAMWRWYDTHFCWNKELDNSA